MSELYKKIISNKKIFDNVINKNQKFEFISTGVITLNLLLSGKFDGGIPIGKLSQFSAPSGQGKSFVGLTLVKNAQKKGLFCVVLDTENSFDFDFAKRVGIDTSEKSLIVIQNNFIEKIQEDLLSLLDPLTREEKSKIFILVDSYGCLITSKTYANAIDGRDVSDMTTSRKKNDFSKMLMGTGTTCFVINHTYDAIGGFGDPLKIPGGRGLEYVSYCIVLGQSKAKEKDSNQDITGSIITCKTKKSRLSREHSSLQFRIKSNGGLDVFYGLLDDAIDSGIVTKDGHYLYRTFIEDDKKVKEKDIYNKDWWMPIFKETDFKNYLENKYSFNNQEVNLNDFDIDDKIITPKDTSEEDVIEEELDESEDVQDTENKKRRGRPSKK